MAPWTASRFQLVMVILKRWWHEQDDEDNAWQSWYLDWSIDSDDNMRMRERETADFDYLQPSGSDLISEYDLDTLIFEDTMSPELPDHDQDSYHHPDSPLAYESRDQYDLELENHISTQQADQPSRLVRTISTATTEPVDEPGSPRPLCNRPILASYYYEVMTIVKENYWRPIWERGCANAPYIYRSSSPTDSEQGWYLWEDSD